MSFYDTGLPVPSNDPRDLDDNAKHIDELVNSTFPTFVDRLGTTRRTLAGIEQDNSLITSPTGSTLVGTTAPGAGSVARALDEKLYDEISVKDKGGVGDGVANDTASFVEAGNSGRTVHVPDGNWNVTVTTDAEFTGIIGALSRMRLDGPLSINFVGRRSSSVPVPYRVIGGENLSIKGTPSLPATITGQFSVSGSAGARDVTLTLSSVAGISVGDWLKTTSTVGTGNHYAHRGTWEIKAVDVPNSRVTVRNSHWAASFPTNTITSSTSVVIQTTLFFVGCDGIVNPSSVLGELKDIVIAGNSDSYWSSSNVAGTEKGTHGVMAGSVTVALNGKIDDVNKLGRGGGHVSAGDNFAVSGFDQQGIVVENGSFWGDFLCSCNNKRRGLYISTGGSCRAKHLSAGGNFLDGVLTDISGALYASSQSYSGGNGQCGTSSTSSAPLVFDSGILNSNGSHGSLTLGAFTQITNAIITNNGGAGATATYKATLVCNNTLIDGNGTYGIDALDSSVRASSCTIQNHPLNGVRATEKSYINHTGSTFTANTGGNFGLRADGLLQDGSAYRQGIAFNTEYRAVNITTLMGSGFISSSGGDDFQIRHDTVGSGTYTVAFHARSGNAGFYPETDGGPPIGTVSKRFSAVNAVNALYTGAVKCGQFTLATLPSASTFNGYEIDVTDATGGPKRCRSNGTVWQILNTTTTVS